LSPDDAKTARTKGDKRALTAVAKIKEFRNFPTHVPAPPPKQNGAEKKEGEEKKEAQKPEMKEVRTGDLLGPTLFNVGEFVDAIGITKGRGFEGVVGRWAFRGGDSTHGAKGWHRRSGAIGCRLFPGHVNKGMKMPGHMGQVRRTAQNLEIIQVREADNLLLIKGSFPGSEGDYVITVQWYKPVRVGNDLVGGPNVLPARYASTQTSDVKVRIAAGENHLQPIQLR